MDENTKRKDKLCGVEVYMLSESWEGINCPSGCPVSSYCDYAGGGYGRVPNDPPCSFYSTPEEADKAIQESERQMDAYCAKNGDYGKCSKCKTTPMWDHNSVVRDNGKRYCLNCSNKLDVINQKRRNVYRSDEAVAKRRDKKRVIVQKRLERCAEAVKTINDWFGG